MNQRAPVTNGWPCCYTAPVHRAERVPPAANTLQAQNVAETRVPPGDEELSEPERCRQRRSGEQEAQQAPPGQPEDGAERHEQNDVEDDVSDATIAARDAASVRVSRPRWGTA